MRFTAKENARSLDDGRKGFWNAVSGTFVIGKEEFKGVLSFTVRENTSEGVFFQGTLTLKNPTAIKSSGEELKINIKGKQ